MSIRAQGERGGKGMQAPIQAEVIGYLGAKYKWFLGKLNFQGQNGVAHYPEVVPYAYAHSMRIVQFVQY